jgi:hypothetical protein
MDDVVATLKSVLNEADERLAKQADPNMESKMMNYFLRTKEKENLASLINYDDSDDDEDEKDDDGSDGDIYDYMESDDETIDPDDTEDNRCGSVLERSWKRCSKALQTDIAIAGWMCSPHPDIMADCNENNIGDYRVTVTRLLRKWFEHTVVR